MSHISQFDRGQNAGISFSSGLLKPLTMVADLFAAGAVARTATGRVAAPAPFANRRLAGGPDVLGFTAEGFTVFW